MTIQLVPAVQSYVSRGIQSEQSLNKVVDAGCVRQLPTVQTVQSCCVHRQGRHPYFRTVEVPQIQSSTEFNDDLEAVLAHFSDSPERG